MKNVKTSYISLSIDVLHHGHINLIKAASKYKLTVGLLTDKAISEKKRIPVLNYENRKEILTNIKGVYKVVPQNEWDYSKNLKKLKPDFFFHGDDWNLLKDNKLKINAEKALKSYGGKLIEIPYTKNISSTELINAYNERLNTKFSRNSHLKRLINSKNIVRIIETHSPISAIIAENINYTLKNELREFDGFWSSSLTDSTILGKPDNEILNISERVNKITQIMDVTSKPLIMDIDTGGKIEHLQSHITSLQNQGVSAVIMEDKKGLKKNSLFGTSVKQYQETPNKFVDKIKLIKKIQINKDFMVIARIESLILGKSVQDALKRANLYLKSGVDGIMIHTAQKDPKEIFKFAKKFRKSYKNIPLVAVPSSYSQINETQLIKNGFNVVIYANQMFRSTYPAMMKTALSILKNKRSFEAEKDLMSIKDILNLISIDK